MKEIKKDLFECIFDKDVDAICITTNGHYMTDGLALMGGGCALECANRWPETQKRLGKMLKYFVNIPFVIGALDKDSDYIDPTENILKNKEYKCLIFSFPTIDNLADGSDISLIKRSAIFMNDYADKFKLKHIVCARFGSGIGGLNWYTDVKPVIETILDDRFTIVSFDHEG